MNAQAFSFGMVLDISEKFLMSAGLARNKAELISSLEYSYGLDYMLQVDVYVQGFLKEFLPNAAPRVCVDKWLAQMRPKNKGR